MDLHSDNVSSASTLGLAPWAQALAALRTSTPHDELPIWDSILRYQIELTQHLAKEGLELLIDLKEGFACLKQMQLDDTGRTIGLMRRMPLTYEVSLVCILLREWLEEFDISANDSRHLYINHGQLQERIQLFFPEHNNQMKLLRELDSLITKVEKLGFLEAVKTQGQEPMYKVMRILKARVTDTELEDFLNQQEAYAQSIQPESD